jgi:transcriptional regulator with XRE-family HTH domain
MSNHVRTQYTAEENARLRTLLTEYAAEREWSHRRLAQELGVGEQTVRSFLSGVNNAGATMLRAMERLLGQSAYQLLGRTEAEMAPTPSAYTPTQYTAEENDKLRSLLAEYAAKQGWSGRRLSQELGVSQQTVHAFLGGINNAGATLLRAMERLFGQPSDQLLGRTGPETVPWRTRLPGWDAAVAEARTLLPFRKIPDQAWDALGGWSGPNPPKVDPHVIGALAAAWWSGVEGE